MSTQIVSLLPQPGHWPCMPVAVTDPRFYPAYSDNLMTAQGVLAAIVDWPGYPVKLEGDHLIGTRINDLAHAITNTDLIMAALKITVADGKPRPVFCSILGHRRVGYVFKTTENAGVMRLFVPRG